jgi:hypothetical protein
MGKNNKKERREREREATTSPPTVLPVPEPTLTEFSSPDVGSIEGGGVEEGVDAIGHSNEYEGEGTTHGGPSVHLRGAHE